jgi:FMN reductase
VRRLIVVSAGLSQPSATRLLADRLATATSDGLAAAGHEVDVETIELRELARDLVDHLLTGFPSPRLGAAIASVRGADGLIAVTPIFNASYSGLFKVFFDVLEQDALAGVPVLVAATEDWGSDTAGVDGALTERIERAARDLVGWMVARAPTVAADPFADPPAFADLLRDVAVPETEPDR